MWLSEHYPTWDRAYYKDTPTGLDAVAAGEADCVIISNYRYNNISKQCEKLNLTTVYTGVDMDYCLAVNKGNVVLYSILTRVINAVPSSVVHTALGYYSTEDVKTSFMELIKENLLLVILVVLIIISLLLLLLLRNIRAEKRVVEEKLIVNDLNERLLVDVLTSVWNRRAFKQHITEIQEKLDRGERPEFAICMFDCNNLKEINDHYGHDNGDIYIRAASQLIRDVFEHSPVFRISGDEFAVILQDDDYQNREKLILYYGEKRQEICSRARNKWEEPRVAMGIAVYDPSKDKTVADTLHRADAIMYENKRIEKETPLDCKNVPLQINMI